MPYRRSPVHRVRGSAIRILSPSVPHSDAVRSPKRCGRDLRLPPALRAAAWTGDVRLSTGDRQDAGGRSPLVWFSGWRSPAMASRFTWIWFHQPAGGPAPWAVRGPSEAAEHLRTLGTKDAVHQCPRCHGSCRRPAPGHRPRWGHQRTAFSLPALSCSAVSVRKSAEVNGMCLRAANRPTVSPRPFSAAPESHIPSKVRGDFLGARTSQRRTCQTLLACRGPASDDCQPGVDVKLKLHVHYPHSVMWLWPSHQARTSWGFLLRAHVV
jgi:hypothetical protein